MIRYEFFDYDVSDSNVHPNDIFENERELASQFVNENNVAKTSNHYLFKRYNVPYIFDENKNLVAQINITSEIHNEYFSSSPLSKLRASEEYQKNVKNNREKIWNSYIDWIEGRCFRYLDNKENLNVLDIGSRNVGWVEKLKSSDHLSNISLMDSLPPIKTDALGDEKFDVIIALDVIQREINPSELLNKIKARLSDDGLVTFAFRSGTGFDVLALKESSKSIFPLDHLFLPSIKGFKTLLESNGLKVKEITTPGQLDAEIVKKSVERGDCTDPLLTHLVETVPVEELQVFIQKNNLSSHVRVVAQKA